MKVFDHHGRTFMRTFDEDQFAHIWQSKNLYYHFADHAEWNMVEFLPTSSLSMANIDCFFSLLMVCIPGFMVLLQDPDNVYNKIQGLGLLFQTASRLCSLTEILPKMPPWKCCVIDTSPHQTKNPARLFYCDTVKCLEMLLNPTIWKFYRLLSLPCIH
ncbi:hypothetical protein JVT61DRAFT_1988 [Boletus reticuloceps]|uniref:Uncharacterized protein n=1 Tax=Boletus reticuloceps TaxID=495285 RepID=A0A8I2YNQ2_9AGAM|nr:hypothetical protein JVT61DRAFT_1988 [Boletus reticuloceps]